jgi:hypothetical protein
MKKGTDPADPKVQALEKRRQALVNAFTGGDKGIAQSLKRLWTDEDRQIGSSVRLRPEVNRVR